MDDDRLSQSELAQLFGDAIPMEAVSLIWTVDGAMTIGELRTKLREMAPAWRRKQAIRWAVSGMIEGDRADLITDEVIKALDALPSA